MNAKKLTAMFVMSLVLALPVYSSLAMAGLSNLEIKGIDGVNGYVRRQDFLDIKAIVSLEGDSVITSNQVRFGGINFDSCTAGAGGYVCTLRFPPSGYTDFNAESTPIFVSLYSDDNILRYAAEGAVVIDANKPAITLFRAVPNSTNGGGVNFEYSIVDYAYYRRDTGKCSGIKSISITNPAGAASTININAADCAYSGSFIVNASNITSGSYSYSAKAYDRFNQESDIKSASFTVDNVAPAIISGSFRLTDSRGNQLGYVSTSGLAVTVKVDASGDVYWAEGDFTGLGGAKEIAYCEQASINVSTCRFDFNVFIYEAGAKNMSITVYDAAGNSNSAKFSKTFSIDSVKPVVDSIMAGFVYENQLYSKAYGANFTASITEAESGLVPGKVKLHITDPFNKALVKIINPNSCEEGWACIWRNVDLSGFGDIATVSIESDSTDAAGNKFDKYSANIVIDKENPVFQSAEVKAIGGTLPAYEYIKTGDSLEVSAIIIEDGPFVKAYADFSNFVSGAAKAEGICIDIGGNKFKCSWTAGPINVPGYKNAAINFAFEDIAGNKGTGSKSIVVYGLDVQQAPNYWTNSVDCMPSKVDRATTALINQKVFCKVNLKGSGEVLSLSLGQCEGDTGQVEAIQLMNSQNGSTTPYINVLLQAQEYLVNKLTLKCSLNILSKVGQMITGYSETEDVMLNINFYNMPLGEYSAELEEKIDDAKDFAWYLGDWVDWAAKIERIGSRICGLYSTLIQAYYAVVGLGNWLGFIGETSPGMEPVRQAGAALHGKTLDGGDLLKNSWLTWGDRICKFFSCRLILDKSWAGETIGKVGQWQETVLKGANWVGTLGTDKYTGISAYYSKEDRGTGFEQIRVGAQLNAKDSIVLSVATLCIPGIIYNLNKLRQIECMYVDCLENAVPEGLPLTACEEQKDYSTCKYWWGELFRIMPITGLFNRLSELVREALSSPFGVVDIVLGQVCAHSVMASKIPYKYGSTSMAAVCLVNDLLGVTAEVVEDIKGIGEGWEIQNDYCEKISEDE